ncbi:MAG: tetratricopeptide repeat protein [Lysobacteraceae bacterium]|nr:MAG: tetratricopeptide repeat protein [Xanthomonadaceae bacterium]
MHFLRGLSILSLACATTFAAGADVRLPDIGSSAAAIMSPQELREYGLGLLQQLRAYDLVLEDPLVADYVNSLGYRLVASSGRDDSVFTFVALRDPGINAFAAPGGLIGINAGLLTAMRSEQELAGVVAHEIAHVQQQHILRAFEDQKKMSIPIMLGMLGVMIAASGRTDDAAAAAMITGTSLMQQRQIDFTRSEEAEADRIGIQTLARAGYDPGAMAGAFSALQKVMRVNGIDVPEFLRSHPLDTRRIAEARARAAQLGCPEAPRLAARPAPAPVGPLDLQLRPSTPTAAQAIDAAAAQRASDTATATVASAADEAGTLPPVAVNACVTHTQGEPYFELIRERVRVQMATSPATIRAYYADNLRDDRTFDTLANRYGFALALVRAGDPGAAIREFDALVQRDPDSSVLRLALATAKDQAGDRVGARAVFDRLQDDFPGNRAVTLGHAQSLLGHGDAASARRALELLRPLLERRPGDPDLQRSFGRASDLAGDKVRAAEAYAEAAWLGGHAEDALNQLKALVKQPDLTYYQRSRIDARITQLTPAVLELRKRSDPAAPDSLAPAFGCCRVR